MKRMPAGYTIIEVMMFLLVSSALLGAIILTISGRDEKVRFTQSVETFERNLNDILNDVSTGYYPTASDFSCVTAAGGGIDFANSGSTAQGANSACVYLGKAVELGDSTSTSNYNIHTVVGPKSETATLSPRNKLLGTEESRDKGIVEKKTISADVEIKKVVNLASNTVIVGFAVMSNGSQVTNIDNKVVGNGSTAGLYKIDSDYIHTAGKDTMSSANEGILICLQQTGGGSKGAVVIGASGGHLSTETFLNDNEITNQGCD